MAKSRTYALEATGVEEGGALDGSVVEDAGRDGHDPGQVDHGGLPALGAHPGAGGCLPEPGDVIGQFVGQRRNEAGLVDSGRACRYRRKGLADSDKLSVGHLSKSSRLPVVWLVMG